MAEIEIRDVGPRDGLQSESPVAPARRAALAVALADAGVRHVEAASFVSPKAVPSMAGGDEVVAELPERDDVTWWALVPNARGAELGAARPACGTSPSRSPHPMATAARTSGVPTEEAVASLAEIGTTPDDQAELDVVISCAFGSPFDDVGGAAPGADIAARTLDTYRPPASRWPTRPAPPRRGDQCRTRRDRRRPPA